MAICNFFLRGNCKYGNNCRNEHPQDGQRQGGFANQTWTNHHQNRSSTDSKLSFTIETLQQDITPQKEKPFWPLTSYGAAKHEPTLISGLDESPEELRVRAFTAQQSGNLAQYASYENDQINHANQTYANARNNLSQVFGQAAKQSPSVTPQGSALTGVFGGGGGGSLNSAFGAAPASTAAFGKSAFNHIPSAFGTSSFGNPATTTTSSTFGNPAFGPSAFGQPAFGQPALAPAPATTSAFGQTPTPGSSSGFGQPSTSSGASSAFGQTSAFGQPPPSTLIKPASGAFSNLNTPSSSSTTTTNSSFGGGGGGFSAFAGKLSVFGAGAPTTTTTTTNQPNKEGSVFGQPAFGQPAPTTQTSAFGRSSSAFGGNASGFTSAFGGDGGGGAAPAFGNTASFGTSVFGNPTATTPATTSSFGAVSPFGPTSTFGGGSAFTPIPIQPSNSLQQAAPLSAVPMASPSSTSSSTHASEKLKKPDFSKAKSWYTPGLNPYDQSLPEDYMSKIPKEALEAFQSQKFSWDNIPEFVPPLEVR